MNQFKRFIAFAVAVVMICGTLPVSALAVEPHDHSAHTTQPFTSTADLIEQVKAQLLEQGKTYTGSEVDEKLVEAVESKSDYSYNQAETMLGMGFLNSRTGSEGQISTSLLNLDETTMVALVENTLKDYYLDGIVEVDYVVEDGVVDTVNFTMRDSFAAGLDEIDSGVGTANTETASGSETPAVLTANNGVSVQAEKNFPFTDVPSNHWARKPINYLYQNGIIAGVSATKFGPDYNVTRAQAVAMIWRAMGKPSNSGKNPFKDLKNGEYYVDAVLWASENGIVSGTSSNRFSPDDNITREQLVAIIYRLAKFVGMDVSNKASISSLKDAGRISSYAVEAVQWAVGSKLVNGYPDGTFRPLGNATRAEYSQVLYSYLQIPVHTLKHVAATASTCTTAGNIEYWYCTDCGKYYADSAAKKEIAQKDTVLALDTTAHKLTYVAAVASSCDKNGTVEHWLCEYCGKTFSDKDGKNEIAQITTPTAHTLTHVEAVAHTCTEDGTLEHYKCSKCGKIFADAEAKQELASTADPAAHTLTYVERVAAVCDKDGVEAHWLCSVCGKKFADENGEKEVTDEDLVIKATGGDHELAKVEAVASTCCVNGTVEHYACVKCGATYADAEGKEVLEDISAPLDPTAHNPVAVAEVPATCTNPGKAAHYKCECGLIVDAQGNVVSDEKDLEIPASGHCPAEDAEDTTWNWERQVSYYMNTDAEGNYTFNQGLKDADGNPVPDFPVDENGNMIAQLYFDAKTGEITAGYQEIITWTCDSVTFTCAGCGASFTEKATVDSYTMTEEWINKQLDTENTDGVAYKIAYSLIEQYVSEKAMNYYSETGEAPSQEQLDNWAYEAQNDASVQADMNTQITAAAMEMYMDLDSTIYVATCEGKCTSDAHKDEPLASFSTELNATKDQLQKDWATMCSFNEYYSKYFGLVAPYWNSKNTEASPMGAVIYMCSQEEQAFIPNYSMDYMVSMLTQAFMSYVMSYGELLDGMIEDALAAVNYKSLDDIDKLLLLHDWLATYGTFDMQSLVDITAGTREGNDPIAMTAFGVLLNDQIDKGENATWDGGVCLGYAASYALLVQQAFGMKQDDDAMIDFVKIQFLTDVASSSVASGDSGFGDGMFNSAHYLNAVCLDDTWYYIDACYDDISTEVISQERVETDGNVAHTSFLVAPSSWEEMYEDNFQYMDSLYDGKVWNRVPDGEGGYVKVDADGNKYTESEADQKVEDSKDEDGNATIQMFYYYEESVTSEETRYEDDTYETAWFVSANSAVTYDDSHGYFYYTSGAVNSYSSMKDLFGDDDDSGMGNMDFDMDDMLEYKNDPSAQDKIVRRPVDAQNEPEESNSSYSMSQNSDPYCEILFHFGYGMVGAEAQAQYEEDMNDNNFGMGGDDEEVVTGEYYWLCEEDAEYMTAYPELVHSTVLMDGKVYFNIANYIYTFNFTIDQIGEDPIDQITNLELVKVKEYNSVNYTHNGKGFTGMGFEVSSEGKNTLTYHPIAALSVRKDFKNNSAETLFVSLGTNFSNSYKDADGNAYTVEARNYNDNYYRFMDEENDEDTNTNTEFMWCANVVDKMVVADLISDLKNGETETVSVDAYCARNAFTETRTKKFGLTVGSDKTEEADTALDHQYEHDDKEDLEICSVCLKAHEHDYSNATLDDVIFEWSVTEDNKLTATAHLECENDEFCNADKELDCVVTENEDGSFTARATKGTSYAYETKTVEQVKHTEHTYGEPVFAWNDDKTAATATFTCQADEDVCAGSSAEEEEREVTLDAKVEATGDSVATVVGPDGKTYTDTIHTYSVEKSDDGNYKYVTVTMDKEYDTFTAVYHCTNCDHTHEVKGELDVSSTASDCTEAGVTTYTAKVEQIDAVLEGKADETDGSIPAIEATTTENGEALGHNYKAEMDWETGKVTYTCSRCDADPVVVTAAVKSEETKKATCTEDGEITYTAMVEDEDVAGLGDVEKKFTKTETVKATGHDYGEGVMTWTYTPAHGTLEESMAVTVKFQCVAGDDTKSANVSTPTKGADGTWSASYINDNGETITVTHTHKVDEAGKCVCGYAEEVTEPDPEPDVHEHKYTCSDTWKYSDGKMICTVQYTCEDCDLAAETVQHEATLVDSVWTVELNHDLGTLSHKYAAAGCVCGWDDTI